MVEAIKNEPIELKVYYRSMLYADQNLRFSLGLYCSSSIDNLFSVEYVIRIYIHYVSRYNLRI